MQKKLRTIIVVFTFVFTGLVLNAQRSHVPDHSQNYYLWVSGSGAATASDASTADATAYSQAQYNAMAACAGYSYDLVTSYNLCNEGADANGNIVVSCSVTVSMLCWVVVH
jgi:hypothetical protein